MNSDIIRMGNLSIPHSKK